MGCRPPGGGAAGRHVRANTEGSPGRFECKLFYRPSEYVRNQRGPVFALTRDGDERRFSYRDLRFSAELFGPEGPASVTKGGLTGGGFKIGAGNKEGAFSRTLYQFGRLRNQFGDHGFTGLVYVNSTKSGAELQYFCSWRHDRRP